MSLFISDFHLNKKYIKFHTYSKECDELLWLIWYLILSVWTYWWLMLRKCFNKTLTPRKRWLQTTPTSYSLILDSCANLLMYPFPFSPQHFPTYPKSSYIMPHFRRQPRPYFLQQSFKSELYSGCKLFYRSQHLVEFGRTSCFCRGLWEKPKLELSNYHRKVNFASFLVADCVLAGQAVIFLTGLSEVFISILATSVRYQGFNLLSSLV